MTAARLAEREGARGARLRDAPLLGGLLTRLGAITALAVVVAPVAYLGAWPPMAIVMSPSMEPAISTGDVVLLRSLRGSRPARGDVVVVPVPADVQRRLRYPDRLVHRVVEVTPAGVRTKGDNLDDPDPFTVRPGDVEDRVLTVVPGAGRVLGFLQSPFGMLWLVLGAVVLSRVPLVDRRGDPSQAATSDPALFEDAMEEMSRSLRELAGAVAALERGGDPVVRRGGAGPGSPARRAGGDRGVWGHR